MKKPTTWPARLFASALLLLSIAPTAPVVTTATVAGGAASLGLAPFVTTSSLLALAASTKADAGIIQASGSKLYNASGGGGGGPFPGYTLTWYDEFNGSGALDSAKWTYEVGAIRNSEDQYYQSGTNNATQSGGNLVITGKIESVGGKSYTSASVITLGKKSFLYGILEIRAKIPSFTGSWSAIWMQGITGSWPARGELDIMEHVGFDPTNVHPGNIHTTYQDDNSLGSPPYFNTVGSFDPSAWHTYRLDWTTARMQFYIDDTLAVTFTNDGGGTSHWPFDNPQYLMLNLAVGGSWGGCCGATDNSAFPATYLIDYVRYYE